MGRKPTTAMPAAKRRNRAGAEAPEFDAERGAPPTLAELHHRAEVRLRNRPKPRQTKGGIPASAPELQRLLHELQVHQVELEMQNAEVQEARDRVEALLEKYTDLYDFAPVGYFSLDEEGRILEVNLTGVALLGVERSRLIHRRLPRFAVPASQPILVAFLERIFNGAGRQICEAQLLKADGTEFWADFHAVSAVSLRGPRKWCRVAVSDITAFRRAEEAQRRTEALAVANRELQQEIIQRQAVEAALKQSEEHQTRMLEQSRRMEEQLRHLSREILAAQEEERRRISRELHDEISQTLVGIHVHLETLAREVTVKPRTLRQRIAHTQRLVERSVRIVHQFARELRPTMLDDLGLIPALHSHIKDFTKRTGLHVRFTAFAAVEQLNSARRTVLYRVAQAALHNVAQHAQASRITLSIRKLPPAVRMEIQDDGKGFELDRVFLTTKYKRLGLLGMRERIEMIGGHFSVVTAPGQGTTIRADIPVSRGSHARPTRRSR